MKLLNIFFCLSYVMVPNAQAQTWTLLDVPPDVSTDLYDISFVSPDTGWAVGGASLSAEGDPVAILYTDDGAVSWVLQESPDAEPLYAVDCINELHCVAAGDGMILFTIDGATWELADVDWPSGVGATTLWGVAMADETTGVAVGYHQTVLRTSDGGETWETIAGLLGSGSLQGVHFANDTQGWLVGDDGVVRETNNAGLDWSDDLISCVDETLWDVWSLDGSAVWVSGYGGTMLSRSGDMDTDGCWGDIQSLSTASLWGVSFATAEVGWAVGASGAVWGTTNGGDSWAAAEDEVPGTDQHLRAVECPLDDVCYVVGDEMTILRWGEPPRADLTIEFSLASCAYPANIRYVYVVTNSGEEPSDPFSVLVESLDEKGGRIGEASIHEHASLAPGESATTDWAVATYLWNPDDAPTVTLQATADRLYEVVESHEDNNIDTITTACCDTPPPCADSDMPADGGTDVVADAAMDAAADAAVDMATDAPADAPADAATDAYIDDASTKTPTIPRVGKVPEEPAKGCECGISQRTSHGAVPLIFFLVFICAYQRRPGEGPHCVRTTRLL